MTLSTPIADLSFEALVAVGVFQQNHLVPSDVSAFHGLMYDPFGFQEEFVRTFSFEHPRRIATLIKRGGEPQLSSGFHFVGRVGYFIAKSDLPWFEGLPLESQRVDESIAA